MGTCLRIIATCIVLTLTIGGRVAAAPRILGLVATEERQTLTCVGGMRAAEFNAFCMQKQRTSPAAGAVYRAAKGAELTLTYTDRNGAKQSLPASDRAIIKAYRDYRAAPIAQPGDKLPLG